MARILPPVSKRFVYTALGLAAGFSGLAVMGHILTRASLFVAEALLVTVAVVWLGFIVRRAPRARVLDAARLALVGAAVGVVATLVYDATRTALSLLDPSPYDPFEAIRAFGRGLLPGGADQALTLGVGFALHLVNGSTFGIIYVMFAGVGERSRRYAVVSGMAWGVTLELIQSILYPGWLGITTVLGEFVLISGAGHLVYGATLGVGTWGILHRRSRGDARMAGDAPHDDASTLRTGSTR